MNWKHFYQNRFTLASFVVILTFYIVAIFAPLLAPYQIDEMDFAQVSQKPSLDHWMGTDGLGRDVLSLVIYGSRVSLTVGLVAAVIAVTVGTLAGAMAGYYGGLIDHVVMQFTDIMRVFPTFFLILTVVAMFGNGIYKVIVIIGFTSWMGVARLVRSQVLSLKTREFVEGARALGARDGRIILRHLLPNMLAPIIVAATLRMGSTILVEAALSFLGLGVREGTVSWGGLLQEAQGMSAMVETPWVVIFPGVVISITVLAFNRFGDGLRDALDPKSKP